MSSDLLQLRDAISSSTSGMSDAELAQHAEGKWCVSEILEHLYLSYTGTIKGFERCLAEGKPLARKPGCADRIKTFAVTRIGYMPSGRKAPERTTPKGTPAAHVVNSIGPTIAALDDLISRCEERFGKNERLLDHPILGPLTGDEWRRFHRVHGMHHVKQIREKR